ncbi:Zinc transporter ZupT [Porphyridium purpureum]|uniref:Zinc transporter ZupT n=1 Tax=Porphyridium purpureum TaxID=35688 RepID=A0A5J4YTY7_PORPP|nr:Zinc transporter ZupT [Porphyridium purpureum]|eukprot:POR1673..scf229_5
MAQPALQVHASSLKLSLIAGLFTVLGAMGTAMLVRVFGVAEERAPPHELQAPRGRQRQRAGSPRDLRGVCYTLALVSAMLLGYSWCDLLPEAMDGLAASTTMIVFAAAGLIELLTSLLLRGSFNSCGARIRQLAHRNSSRTIFATAFAPTAVGTSRTGVPTGTAARRQSPTAPLVNHQHLQWPGSALDHELRMLGRITTVIIGVHNLLEGFNMAFAGAGASREGSWPSVSLVVSLMLENIPEGILLAVPVYCGSRSFKLTLGCAFCAGMLEPVGVRISPLVLLWFQGSRVWLFLPACLATISGMVSSLLLVESIPFAVKNTTSENLASLSLALGLGFLLACVFQPLLIHLGKVQMVS